MKRFIKEHFFDFNMGEIDYVIPSVNVDWEGKLDLREIYSFCKKWILERKYDLSENEYHNDETEKGNNIRIKWWAFKKIDDYTRFNIDVIFTGKNLKQVAGKKNVLFSGSFNVQFESYLERDYENIWASKPWRKFVREIMDKFFHKGKFEKYHEELKEETLTLRDSVKRFFNAVEY